MIVKPITAATKTTKGLNAVADAEFDLVLVDGLPAVAELVPLELEPEPPEPVPLGAVAVGFGAPKSETPLARGPGSADAEAPTPAKNP